MKARNIALTLIGVPIMLIRLVVELSRVYATALGEYCASRYRLRRVSALSRGQRHLLASCNTAHRLLGVQARVGNVSDELLEAFPEHAALREYRRNAQLRPEVYADAEKLKAYQRTCATGQTTIKRIVASRRRMDAMARDVFGPEYR